jgi:thioredoxin 1
MATEITQDSDWDNLISKKNLLSVDFWAPWCPYCTRLKPVFESIANDYKEIHFIKVNVDEHPDIASKYGIQGIPVIKFFCENKEIGEIIGYVPKEVLKKKIDGIIEDAPSCLSNTSVRK